MANVQQYTKGTHVFLGVDPGRRRDVIECLQDVLDKAVNGKDKTYRGDHVGAYTDRVQKEVPGFLLVSSSKRAERSAMQQSPVRYINLWH